MLQTPPAKEKLKSAEKQKNKKKVTIAAAIAFVVAFTLSFAGMQYFFADKSPDDTLSKVANELNKNCPITIDRDTRLDNVITFPDRTFQYNYTLTSIEKKGVNSIELKTYLTPKIIEGVRSSPDMKEFRENDVTVNYNYRDKNGTFLFKIGVTPQDYHE